MTSVLSLTLIMAQQNRKILGQRCVLTLPLPLKRLTAFRHEYAAMGTQGDNMKIIIATVIFQVCIP